MSTLVQVLLPSGNRAVYDVAEMREPPGSAIDARELGRHVATRFGRDWWLKGLKGYAPASAEDSERFDTAPLIEEV